MLEKYYYLLITDMEKDVKAKNMIYAELNNAFQTTKKPVFNGQIETENGMFLMKTNENFELFSCINGNRCQCIGKVSKDGYFIQCNVCNKRLPLKGFYKNSDKMNDSLIILGIQINNNNYEAPISLQQTYMEYPLNYDLFKDERKLKKFQSILHTHDKELIVSFYDNYDYIYIKNTDSWVNKSMEPIKEETVFEKFEEFYKDLTSTLINFYLKNIELPIIHNVCYNKHIVMNLNQLYRVISSKENMMPILRKNRINEDYIKGVEHTTISFLDKLSYKKDSYIKLEALYSAYITWYNQETVNCIEPLLSKKEFRRTTENYLEKRSYFKYKKCKQYQINNIQITCFKGVYLG